MKRRILTTQKILAVSFIAAGCASQATPEARPASAPMSEAPTTVSVTPPVAQPVIQPASASSEATSNAAATPAATTPAPASPDKTIYELRSEIERTTREDAMKRVAHFRPLCDKDGFPVVGNTARKGGAPDYSASKFCSEIRTAKR